MQRYYSFLRKKLSYSKVSSTVESDTYDLDDFTMTTTESDNDIAGDELFGLERENSTTFDSNRSVINSPMINQRKQHSDSSPCINEKGGSDDGGASSPAAVARTSSGKLIGSWLLSVSAKATSGLGLGRVSSARGQEKYNSVCDKQLVEEGGGAEENDDMEQIMFDNFLTDEEMKK